MTTSKLPPAIELSFPASLPGDTAAASIPIEEQVLALFDECGPGLRRYAGSFGLGPTATEDVVQEVFLALFQHLRRGRPQTNLKGWLFQVAHNLALKHRHKALKRRHTEGSWDADLAAGVADLAANPEEQLADTQRRQRLWEVLWAIPERDRQCLFLRAEGLRYRDIAATLGISLGSVAKSLLRAVTGLGAAERE